MESDQYSDEKRGDSTSAWLEGIDLSAAWWVFGGEYSREKLRNLKTRHSSDAETIMMQVDLFSRILGGELVAFGHRVLPSPSDGPVPIAAHVFDQRPPPSINEDWIEASGWKFERIRLLPVQSEAVTVAAPEPTNPMSDIDAEAPRTPMKRGGGRRKQDVQAFEILDMLFASPSRDRGLSAAQLLEEFNQLCRQHHQSIRLASVSERSLRTYLTAYRQKSASIGKN